MTALAARALRLEMQGLFRHSRSYPYLGTSYSGVCVLGSLTYARTTLEARIILFVIGHNEHVHVQSFHVHVMSER